MIDFSREGVGKLKIEINTLAEHFACTSFKVEHVHHSIREPGKHYSGYSEPFPGFVFPISGRAEFVFNGTPYVLVPGHVAHGGACMELNMRVLGNTKWEYILVLYSVCGNEPEDFSLAFAHFELQTGQNPKMIELLDRLWRVSSQPGGIYAFRTETLFRCVLDELFISARNQTNDGAQALFEQITDYMHEHYMDSLAVGALAKQYNVNENRLSYVFHKYAGMGPGDYLVLYRLNRAKDLLLNLEAPIYAVAKSVGYADPYHFSRIFKKQFGMSPSQFRGKFKNNAW